MQLLGRTTHPQVVLQDEIEADAPADLWWFAHTQADVKLNDSATLATLTINGKQLQARLMSPPGARFQVMDATPLPSSPQPAKQNPNTGMRKLAIHLPGTSKTRIAVAFVPVVAGAPDVPLSLKPLSEWSVFSQKTP